MKLSKKIKLKLNKIRIDALKKRLKNKDFTIICNNCVAGVIYNDLSLKFLSPTINLYFYAPDYILFLENFNQVINSDMTFTYTSKYLSEQVTYPIGLLNENIEIHFLHYENIEQAKLKWIERVKRINLDNIFVIGSDKDLCNDEIINRFDNLPFKNKIFFSSKNIILKSVIYISKFKKEKEVGDLIKYNRLWLNYINLTEWLNTGKIVKYAKIKTFLLNFYSELIRIK